MNIDSDYQLPNIQTCQQSPEPIGPDSISSLITPKQSSSSNPFSYEGEADCLLNQNPNNDKSEAQQVSEEPQKISTEDPVIREINNPENTEASDHNFALRLQAELNGWTGDAYAQNAFPTVRYDLEGGVSEETRLFHVALPEAKVYLMQVTGLFITLIITSLCALLPLDDIAYAVIVTFPPLIYCFTWIFLEVRCRSQILGDLWLENGEFFKSFDMANIMILIVVMQFKFMGLTSSCVYAPLFFYSIAHVFVYTSKGLLKKRLPEILTRYLYATQVLIMVLRADEYTDQSWSWVFLLSWIFLATKVFNYLKSMLNLLRKIISTTSSEDAFTNSLGFVWQVGFKGLILVPLMALYGFTVYQGPEKDFRVIQEVAIFTFIVNVMLLATTLLRKERVLSFIVKMELFTSRLLEYERSLLNANIEVKNEVSFEMKKKEEYFVMLSPTYFKPINQGPFAKIKDVVLKNKTKLFKLTAAGNKAKLISQDEDIEKLKHDIKTLRNVNDLEGGSGNKFQTTVFEDSSCYICCLNPSNVVLMGCGHGGVCYDCAVSHIKKKNECMECRKEVDGIYKIQQSSKVFEIVKGYELHKVCK